ncbi:MAG: murein biosynthesis integral membrane protein MurJ [Methylococcaceae bacterium]
MRQQLFKSTVIVSSMSMISRLLGFIRDMLIARIFGVDADSDAFYIAFKIPNFLRRLFAEGAFAQAFVPILFDYKEHGSAGALKLFIDRTAGTLAVLLMLLSLIGVIATPILISVFAPGLDQSGAQFTLAVRMLRITFPYLFFIAGVAFAGSILNSQGKFVIPALTPAFLNICMIAAALWLAPLMPNPIIALAWGIFGAGIVQLLFQLPALMRIGLLPKLTLGFDDPGVKRVLALLLPAIFAASISQINLLLDTAFASYLSSGSVSWLYYSERLVEFPLGILGIAIATVILPSLSKSYITENPRAFSKAMDWGLRWTIVVGLPATIGLVLLAEPLFSALFQYGEFSAKDVTAAGLSLKGYAVGLLAFMLIKILVPGFTARKDVRTPAKFGLYAIIANFCLNLALMTPFAHGGLALATSIAAFFNVGLLLYGLLKDKHYQPQPGWWLFSARILIANSMMAVSVMTCVDMQIWTDLSSMSRLVNLLLIIMANGLGYLLLLYVFKLRFHDISAAG